MNIRYPIYEGVYRILTDEQGEYTCPVHNDDRIRILPGCGACHQTRGL